MQRAGERDVRRALGFVEIPRYAGETDRANNVKAALVALGAAPTSMEAEGYGDQHPVASNDTEEGCAQNRRIDLRVMAK